MHLDLTDTVFAPIPYRPRTWADPYDALQVRDNCVRNSVDSYLRYLEHIERLRDIIADLRQEKKHEC